MDRSGDLDLLLLGKTGNGKSATGNYILGRKAFISRACATSITMDISSEVSEYKGRVIKVVDGPGVGDTRMDNEQGMELVMKAMAKAIAQNDKGYHAFLLVVRFGGRFTKEDREAVELLKAIFGQDFVKNFCILVMTCGDNFERESEETGQTFEQWCREQKGVLQEIYRECDRRAILFDNITKDEGKKTAQLDNLIKMVDNLKYQGRRYCNEHFSRAKDARERAMIQAKEPLIREETMRETSLILQQLEHIHREDKPQNQLAPLKALQTRADALYESINQQDKGTGALHKLSETVESIRRTVYSEVQVCERMITEAEKWRRMEEKDKEEREKFERKMREEQAEFNRQSQQKLQELESRYRGVKTEQQESSVFEKIIDVVMIPVTAIVKSVTKSCVIS